MDANFLDGIYKINRININYFKKTFILLILLILSEN